MSNNFIRELAATAALAPSADNTPLWRLHWNGRELALRYAQPPEGEGAFGAASHATLLSVGAAIDNLDMALAANGVPAHWRWGDQAGQPYAALALDGLPAQFRAPPGPRERHTNRLPFRAAPLPAGLAAGIDGRSLGANRVLLLADRARKARLVKLVQACSEARFCNRSLHAWLFGSLRHTPAEVDRGDGLDMRSLGLPPGGKQLMRFISDWDRMALLNKFGAYKLLARSEIGLVGAAPALLCVVGPSDARATIDAGRLLARVWTELNLEGVAVHPYYVVSDQINRLHDGTLAPGFEARIGAAEQEMRDLLQLPPGQMLHMILRVGYPKAAPVRSRRLPLDQLLLVEAP